mmetsp:Transcript_38982/g.103025  ORF Transcript_38982/g.103025 Transcript_38982/m.103025 type:complete len:273 (-) Transcript_38982:58-876(-)
MIVKLLAQAHLRGLVHQGRLLKSNTLLLRHNLAHVLARTELQALAERDHLAPDVLLTRCPGAAKDCARPLRARPLGLPGRGRGRRADWPGYRWSADASSLLLRHILHGHGLHAREQLLEGRRAGRRPGGLRGSRPGARVSLELRHLGHHAHLLLVVGVAAIRILARAGADKRLAELRASKVRQRIQLFLLVSKLASAPLGAHAQDVELAHLGLGEDHCPRSTFTLGNLSRRTGRRHRLSLRTVPTSLAARHCCCCKGRGRTQSGACGRKAPS